jgi:predicted component of type VI protein secretion system
MAFLTVRIKGSEGYTRSALSKERMVLGRASATDIPIKHTSISREHCAFVREGEKWFVEDLGSSNGTWVGKAKVAGRTQLNERDIVKVGHARLTFHVEELSAAQAEVAIELTSGDDDADGGKDGSPPADERKRGEHDPSEAINCSACGGWFSMAHRLAGEQMPCPRCGQAMTIPVLV